MSKNMTPNIKKYILLYKKQDDVSESEKEEIINILEKIYFELKNEEIDFLELKGYI